MKGAVEETASDIYPEPMVNLPQRKARLYEAVTRLRDDKDILAAHDFIALAEAAGLMANRSHGDAALRPGAAPPDGAQQGRRDLLQRRRDHARGSHHLGALPRFLEANRALARTFVLELKRLCFQSGAIETSIWRRWRSAATASRSTTSPTPGSSRVAADRGVRFIKVPARCCSTRGQLLFDIHPSDLPICLAASAST